MDRWVRKALIIESKVSLGMGEVMRCGRRESRGSVRSHVGLVDVDVGEPRDMVEFGILAFMVVGREEVFMASSSSVCIP